jgi:3-isopropylmalate/(R)-2-methylmalate dehydratase small subunit
MEMGVRCVIAESFGGIFYNNCFVNGLLPVVLPAADVQRLAASIDQGGVVTVDLERCRIAAPDMDEIGFEIDPFLRDGLLNGLDEIGMLLGHREQIVRWQERDRIARPWIWRLPHA